MVNCGSKLSSQLSVASTTAVPKASTEVSTVQSESANKSALAGHVMLSNGDSSSTNVIFWTNVLLLPQSSIAV